MGLVVKQVSEVILIYIYLQQNSFWLWSVSGDMHIEDVFIPFDFYFVSEIIYKELRINVNVEGGVGV